MTKKDIVFLLVPSGLFVGMAFLAFIYADALLPDQKYHDTMQQKVRELVQKMQTGEAHPKPEDLVEALGNSYRREFDTQRALATAHAKTSRVLGWGVLAGVVLQFYVVFRVKAGLRKRDAQQSAPPNSRQPSQFIGGWLPSLTCTLADMNTSLRSRVSATVLSSALIALSALWFVSAWVFHLTNRSSKDGVFGAPVSVLLFLVLIPLSTLFLAPWLLIARRSNSERLRPIDCCGLLAGVAPFIFVGILILIVPANR